MKAHFRIHLLFMWLVFTCSNVQVFAQQEATTSNGQKVLLYSDGTWIFTDSVPLKAVSFTRINKLELPKTSLKDNVISHTGFALLYNEQHEQASWVAYELTKLETIKVSERTNKFRPDPKVKTGTATDKDYKSSGYDRGHLAPAADMAWSQLTMEESFYYSNMSPQDPGFNRGVWKKLEELIRDWALAYDTLYIVTGPVLTNGLPAIGPNKVSVPAYYYKVILQFGTNGVKGLGFVLPNSPSAEPLTKFVVSIDSVENLTGLDFYPLLPDEQEAIIERTTCINCWIWNNTKTTRNTDTQKQTTSTQCSGVTQAGNRCRNNTRNSNGYCHVHQTQVNGTGQNSVAPSSTPRQTQSTSVQCSGTTKAGNRCKRMTTSPSGRCYQH